MTRTLIVLACVAFFLLCVAGMRLGWRNRGRRQSALTDLPTAPVDRGATVLGPVTGLYVGTTTAEHWQDRVVAGGLGLRAGGTATLYDTGLAIDRDGADPIFIPRASIRGAGLGAGLAGKVMGAGGLLVVRWQLGTAELDTGFRADDKSVYPEWVLAIDKMESAV